MNRQILNPVLIVIGIILVIVAILVSSIASPPSLLFPLVLFCFFAGLLIGSFGIANYINLNLWIKLILAIILALVFFVLLFGIVSDWTFALIR